MSHCLDVMPGKDEKERDDNRDWSSDVASNLSMAVKQGKHLSLRGWKKRKDETPPLPAKGRVRDDST